MEDYILYDPETDQTFIGQIPRGQGGVYDLDQNKRYRLLNELKKQAAQPSVIPSDASSSACEATSTTGVIHRAQGELGANWRKGNATATLLNKALPYRKWLRGNIVQREIWQRISDDLYNNDKLDYSWEQIRAKIKSLKKQFKSAKEEGKLNGQNWEHYWLMSYLYDEPISSSNTTLCPPGFDPFSSQNQHGIPSAEESIASAEVITHNTPPVNSVDNAGEWQDHLSQSTELIPQQGINIHHVTSSVPLDVAGEDLFENSFIGSLLNFGSNDSTERDLNATISQGLNIPTNGDATLLDSIVGSPGFSSTIMPLHSQAIGGITSGCLSHQVRSPAHKKNKGGPLFSIPHRSPVKISTPKRKSSKTSLQWPKSETEAFTQLCEGHKQKLVVSHISNDTWKSISLGLQEVNIDKTWQVCRDKFDQMRDFFEVTILPAGGYLGPKKWAFYPSFCKIYDIPEDYNIVVGTNVIEQSPQQNQSSARIWTPDNVLLLLSLYKPKHKYFVDSKSVLRHNYIWAQISNEMQSTVQVTAKQCKAQISELKQQLNKEALKDKTTGQSPSKWPYLLAMQEIFGTSASLTAPFSLSTGAASSYCAAGLEIEEVPRTSRTRPADKESTSKIKPPAARKLYQSLNHNIQEQQSEQRDKLLSVVQQLQVNMQESGRERIKVFANINETLDQIKKSIEQNKEKSN